VQLIVMALFLSPACAAIEVEQKKVGKKDIPLNLICSPDATQKYVVAVMDAAAEAGIKEIEFIPLIIDAATFLAHKCNFGNYLSAFFGN
jgi:hypothetical protein